MTRFVRYDKLVGEDGWVRALVWHPPTPTLPTGRDVVATQRERIERAKRMVKPYTPTTWP